MADTYRVTIVRETGSGADYETETLFEVAGKIGMIVRVAPGALIDALTEAGEDVPVALVDRVMSSAVAALPASHPFGEQAPQPRKRRTKQQIAEDRLREEQAAGIAAGDAGQASEPATVPADDAQQPGMTTPPAAGGVQTPQAVAEGDHLLGGAPAAAPVPAPGGEQYNPFAVS